MGVLLANKCNSRCVIIGNYAIFIVEYKRL